MTNDSLRLLQHPILEQSFAIIDQEISEHNLNPWEYQIARRVIHTTADFDYLDLIYFSPGVIELALTALRKRTPIITDVTLVAQGIMTLVNKTFNNPLIVALDEAGEVPPGKTRSETGMQQCFPKYPHAIYVIGNAPTALLALCRAISESNLNPSLIIGVPVGFVSVTESKEVLASSHIPQIGVKGRKGGSTVAAAILNALLVLAWETR